LRDAPKSNLHRPAAGCSRGLKRHSSRESRGVEPSVDFDLTRVEAKLPEIPLNTSDSAVPGEVSVRIMEVRHAVLVATAPEAPVRCLSIERDDNPDGGWNFSYGLLDATTFDACSGGWAPYMLPPT
jgi:hypothetical protein